MARSVSREQQKQQQQQQQEQPHQYQDQNQPRKGSFPIISWRRPIIFWGATIIIVLVVCLVSETRVLFGSFLIRSTTGSNDRPPLREKITSSSSSMGVGTTKTVLLEVSLPPSHARKLYEDTQESHTSPLSSKFKGRNDDPYYNLQNFVGCKPTEKIQLVLVGSDDDDDDDDNAIVIVRMETFSKDGTVKLVGGDEFYITYTKNSDVNRLIYKDPVTQQTIQHPTLVAVSTDLQNGSYTLEFFTPPAVLPEFRQKRRRSMDDNDDDNKLNLLQLNDGFLTIYLTYTCGMGLVTQKSDWKSRGSLDWVHVQHYNNNDNDPTTITTTNTILSPTTLFLPWKQFQPPTTTTSSTPDNRGRPQRQQQRKLSSYETVIAFGDSILGLFVGQYRKNKKWIRYWSPALRDLFPPRDKIRFRDNHRRPMLNNTEYLKNLFIKWHGQQLLNANANVNNSMSTTTTMATSRRRAAILMGGGIWDLGKITWHGGDEFFQLGPILDAYETFWRWLLNEYPNVDIYWKSLSAMHPHALIDCLSSSSSSASTTTTTTTTSSSSSSSLVVVPGCNNVTHIKRGTMYVSSKRAYDLDLALRKLIKERFNNNNNSDDDDADDDQQQQQQQQRIIHILDVYHATALTAEWLFPSDSHHYRFEMNQYMMMEWFY